MKVTTARPRRPKPCALPEPITDPVESAQAAGLRYVTDAKPGIQRKKAAKGFRYVNPDGTPVRDQAVLGRIKSLVIPPAWQDVWISTHANGHLQATGRDQARPQAEPLSSEMAPRPVTRPSTSA